MNFTLSEEQRLIVDSAARFLTENSDAEAVRRVMESDEDYDVELWRRIREEMGWSAMHIPEAHGGLGLSHVELALIFEQAGYHLLCSPLFSSIALAANALLVCGDEAKMDEYLPLLAAGEKTATLAWLPPQAADWSAAPGGLRCERKGNDYTLDGALGHVLNGASADFLIAVAGEDMFVVPRESEGLSARRLPTMDQTRPLAELRFENVRLPAAGRVRTADGAASTLERTLHYARVALAAEQAGGARRCLDMAVAYACERKQFGRAIGSFQAIKHKCADMMLEVESMRSAAWYAACVASQNADASAAELPEAATLAKCFCSEGFFRCAAENIQLHGGVGFSWEYDPHLYFKRARAGESQLGAPSKLRAALSTRLFEDEARWT